MRKTRSDEAHEIADNAGSRKKRMRVGRGIGSGKGKRQAAAARARPRVPACASRVSKAARCRCIAACRSAASTTCSGSSIAEINLDRLQDAINAKTIDTSAVINAESLVKAGVLRRAKAGVRLLGRGEIKAKINVEVHGASKSAVAAVEKAGGTVKILAPVEPRTKARRRNICVIAGPGFRDFAQ